MEFSHPALWPGAWPAEDGGPRRLAQPNGLAGLGIGDGEGLRLGAVRDALGTTMVILRDPGEVYALRHTLGRRPLEDPVVGWVEQLDPDTLTAVRRSEPLPSGPFWPGGVAAHANGSLIVVTGNHCHRLSPRLERLATARLPAPRPYNSFVVLGDGTIATKDFDRQLRAPARIELLDPDSLEPQARPFELGEPAIARLSADADELYVVGARTVQRLTWDGSKLERDEEWGGPYLAAGASYGWDPVIGGSNLWFLDNGAHDFVTTMRGAALSPGPVHLHRWSLTDRSDRETVEVCGLPRGAVTDPPLFDPMRRIAVAYDSANGVVQAFSFEDALRPLWTRELDHAAHMILYPTGELVLHDFKGPALGRTRVGRDLMRWTARGMHRPRLRALAARGSRDEVVVLNIETGAERGRARVPSPVQSVVFPAPGFGRDLYWVTMTTIARLEVV